MDQVGQRSEMALLKSIYRGERRTAALWASSSLTGQIEQGISDLATSNSAFGNGAHCGDYKHGM